MLSQFIKIKKAFKEGLYKLYLELNPSCRRQRAILTKWRQKSINEIDTLSRTKWSLGEGVGFENVLVDGIWDNPNYWIRFGMFRAALGFENSTQTGVIGKYKRKEVKETFNKLGFDEILDYKNISKINSTHITAAKKILKNTNDAIDILDWKLPFDFPAKIFYDAFLKRQRRARVCLDDPLLCEYIAEGLASLEASASVFKCKKYDLVVLSHAIEFNYASIVWSALKNNVPVVVLYGDYNSCRFIRIMNLDDIFNYPSRPTTLEIEELEKEKKIKLIATGKCYLEKRLSGKTNDISAIYSYKMRNTDVKKEVICANYNWDVENKIIGVYASNWFDYPHCFGLQHYQDFLDWANTVLETAKIIKNINWLIKAHPCDEWYGGTKGITLKSLVDNIDMPHIQMAEKTWNGQSLIQSVDGIVTCHGTIGLEATFLGTPVLAASPSWYMKGGFVKQATSKNDLILHLTKNDWLTLNDGAIKNTKLYAGWYWGIPEWQNEFFFQDDSVQEKIYINLPGFLNKNNNAIIKEINCINDWFKNGHPYYHIYKMKHADSYKTPD